MIDGDAPYRDPWAGGVLTLPHHPRVLHQQAVARRMAQGETGIGTTTLLVGMAAGLWLAATLLVGGC